MPGAHTSIFGTSAGGEQVLFDLLHRSPRGTPCIGARKKGLPDGCLGQEEVTESLFVKEASLTDNSFFALDRLIDTMEKLQLFYSDNVLLKAPLGGEDILFKTEVCWTDIIHWMWALFIESWGSWRNDCLNLSPIPFTDPVSIMPLTINMQPMLYMRIIKLIHLQMCVHLRLLQGE